MVQSRSAEGPHRSLNDYQARACAANQFRGSVEAIDQLRFGLFGEIGGLLAAVKKQHRELGPADQANVQEELGDALWYLATVTAEHGLPLDAVGKESLGELQRRFGVSLQQHAGELTFHEFDGLLALCLRQLEGMNTARQLRQLAAHAGYAMYAGGDSDPDLATHPPLKVLGGLFADLVTVATLFKLTVCDTVESNLRKFESRWPPKGAQYRALFDEGRNEFERFPKQFQVRFVERFTADGKPYVIQQLWGVNIGDRLTDNRTEADGYRFHDVFHLAYITHLGWSPVIRSLLRLKRKSDHDLDENQDGARAMIIEEGIATWIFNHAQRRDYFAGIATGRLEYGLLKQVVDMVQGYEVEQVPLWQWERAILDGFAVFRALRDAGSGVVSVDLDARTITFEKHSSEPQVDAPPQRKRPISVGTSLPPPDTSS
jgi:NTP pyrophosphatase (non-canonical NTP hydrolase)